MQVQSVADGKQLQFSVKDSGIGMNKEQCEALFKPFSQVDDSSSRRYGGAGLNSVDLQESAGTMVVEFGWRARPVGYNFPFHGQLR